MKIKSVFMSIFLVAVSLLLFLPCESDLYCHGKYSSVIQYPFVWFLSLIPISIFALTLKDNEHKFWLKFTGLFFIFSMVLVFLLPEYDSSIFSLDRELGNWFFAGLYSFISIIYFIFSFIKNRNRNK